MLTARSFAKEKGISYTTVMAWLKEGLIPDAQQQDTPAGAIWQIPAASLEKVSERKRGPKKPESTDTSETKAEKKPAAKKPNTVRTTNALTSTPRTGNKLGAKRKGSD